MDPRILIGSRWDNVLGERVTVLALPGGRVSFLRAQKREMGQLAEEEFLAGFKLVDEAEEAKSLKTSELISRLGDRRALRLDVRSGSTSSVNSAKILKRSAARFAAVEAELDARLPPRSS